MKIITRYICDICGSSYEWEEIARRCENQPPPAQYPVGLCWLREDDGRDRDKLAFAIAEQWQGRRHRIDAKLNHYAPVCFWACRDTMYGDSLGQNRCGHELVFKPTDFSPRWMQNTPFLRLVAWLRSQGIVPTVWHEGKPTPLDQFDIAKGRT